jgi:hypothetical protein
MRCYSAVKCALDKKLVSIVPDLVIAGYARNEINSEFVVKGLLATKTIIPYIFDILYVI